MMTLQGGPELGRLQPAQHHHLSGAVRSLPAVLPGMKKDNLCKDEKIFVINIQDTAGCEGWTWINENNELLPNDCLMYSHVGTTMEFPDSIRHSFMRIRLFYYNI